MRTTKYYLLPLGIILLISLGLHYLDAFLTGRIGMMIMTIVRCILFFSFGLSLNIGKRKRYETWIKKVIISFVMIFFLVWELGYVMIPELKNFFNLLGINGYIIYLIYIYCGWSFFD